MQKFIIDGYNVLHADKKLKALAHKDLQRARENLIARIARYLKGRQIRVTLVFDGAGSLTDTESVLPGKLQVIYSPSRQNADQLIVETVETAQNSRELTVVTSDVTDIGRNARALGAQVMSSQAFLERIKGRNKSDKPGRKTEKSGDTDIDIDYWLRTFGEEPPPDPSEAD